MSKEMDVLEHAATNGFNVLLIGDHGVGKTAMVKEVLEDRLNLNWKYFSASTIDPWVDLVGIPQKGENGEMELLRPANLDFDNIEAIFLDEYNRAPKKVRNAVMELIQFKSINGKKFPKLKVVFAAINPDDHEELSYDVEKLDPAQIDRFHIHLPIKSAPCAFYFKRMHGSTGALAVKWWHEQGKEVQKLISPRRLEAAVQVYLSPGGAPKYVLCGAEINVGEFMEYLDKPDPIDILDDLCSKTTADKKAFFLDNNMLKHVRKELLGKERYLKELAHCLPDAELMREMRNTTGNKVIGYMVANVGQFEHLVDLVLDNNSNYSARLVAAFQAYRKSGGATSSASSLNRNVNINGIFVPVNSLALCFSGTLASYNRSEAEQLMRDYGASITGDITGKTTHLVVGDKPGRGKTRKAQAQGVAILNENEFYKIVQELNTPATV